MKTSPHPQWALKHKQKGTELRRISNGYYLYKVKSKWNPEKKRSQKVTGILLGKITQEDGFIASEKNKLRQQPQEIKVSKVNVKEYGFCAFVQQHLNYYIDLLQKHFPHIWESIIGLVYGRIVHQAPLKNMQFRYERSFLSTLHPNASLSPKGLGILLKDLGSDREAIVRFFKEFRTANDCILFDGTDITSNSKKRLCFTILWN